MSSPFFSVILPVFNRETLVLRAIKSVLKQSFRDFEFIIVNDGSTDNTKNIIESIKDPRIKIINTDNLGVSHGRNIAAKSSRGKYFAFIDSDDEWLTHKLNDQYEYLQANLDCKILHGEELWNRNGKRVNPKKIHQKGGGDQFIPSLALCLISPSTVVLERESFFELGMFREDYPVCEDYDLWLKYTFHYDVGFIGTPLIIKYGGHEDQLSTKYKAMDYWRVKSLLWIYENRDLNLEQRSALIKVLKKKTDILILGYEKHGHLDKRDEIISLTSHVLTFSS